MIEQKNRSSNLSDTAREQLLVKPNLNAIELIRNSMVNTAVYNAGFTPREYMKFKKGGYIVDEIKLKGHFTINCNDRTDKLEKLVDNFLVSWQELKKYSIELGFDNVINVYGIIHYDPYSETFTFNKQSSDLKILVK